MAALTASPKASPRALGGGRTMQEARIAAFVSVLLGVMVALDLLPSVLGSNGMPPLPLNVFVTAWGALQLFFVTRAMVAGESGASHSQANALTTLATASNNQGLFACCGLRNGMVINSLSPSFRHSVRPDGCVDGLAFPVAATFRSLVPVFVCLCGRVGSASSDKFPR